MSIVKNVFLPSPSLLSLWKGQASWFLVILVSILTMNAQTNVDLNKFNGEDQVAASVVKEVLNITWPTGEKQIGRLDINLNQEKPLFKSIQLGKEGIFKEIITGVDPAFILTVGERDLEKRGGWNIFFDETAYKPHRSYRVELDSDQVNVETHGSRTKVIISEVTAGSFQGNLEITLFNGSPLVNMAAVMSSEKDSLAIIYDAGLVSPDWERIFWSNTEDYLQRASVDPASESENLAVKYRTIIGETGNGSIAVFPPPHQYFYPLDNAYNLKYVWHGANYRDMISESGIGIRHELLGDRRHVPWFNAPPGSKQSLNFFFLMDDQKDGKILEKVKRFTHGDSYKPLQDYYTMASHFHTEHVMDVLTHKPLPEIPGHVKALRNTGVNIMHLGEFHLAGNPRDKGPRRLLEFKKMFEECARLSSGDFLMLPGEEPNSHFGGHWMNLFPKPVYWIMSREPGQAFVEEHPEYGTVYRVGNKQEMLKLLEIENGLAWTAHARIKGSTGFPDQYMEEDFFKSDRFLGAAWKAMPADLSKDRLGSRVLEVMDDMSNDGNKKYVIAEADLFKIEPDYELYGNMNINYLQLDELPSFEQGWQPVLDAMEAGKFFVSTGEVLLPVFQVNGKGSGETIVLNDNGDAEINLEIDWTFPLSFVKIISGDGEEVFRERINMEATQAFGNKEFTFNTRLKNRKWVRVEVWDAAVNGAFTQNVWLQ
jgi:hypothetical protein